MNMQTESGIIRSSKGDIAAVIHYPETKTGKLAILCPGFLDTKDYAHLIILSAKLSERGYTVVRFDPTGTWGSEGDIADYTATQYLTDVKNILEHMISAGNYTNILLGGHSMGGFIAMMYASQDPRISTVLGLMSPYSLNRPCNMELIEKWKNRGYRRSRREIPGETEPKEFYVPYSHAIDRFKYNVLDNIRQFCGLLILVAGELDNRISPENIIQLYDKANEPKKLIRLKGIGHNYRHNSDEIEIVNESFLAQLQS
jgi:uncharacterized protein